MYDSKTAWLLILFVFLGWTGLHGQSFKDTSFPQPVSKKYPVQGPDSDLQMKKMVIDRDENVYALTNQGLFIIIEDRLVRDRRYRPLADKNPVDISIQDGTGILYYLYGDHYLSNAHAGKPYGSFESQKYTRIAVNERGEILLAGETHVAVDTKQGRETGSLDESIKEAKSYGDDFFLLTSMGIYRYQEGKAWQVVRDAHILDWVFDGDTLFISNDKGYYAVSIESWEEKESLRTRLPVIPATSLAYRDGRLWAGSDIGMYATRNLEDYRYYASRRWLQDNLVLDVAVDSEGNAYALT